MAEVVNCASGDAWRHLKHIEDALLRIALVRIEDCMIADVKVERGLLYVVSKGMTNVLCLFEQYA